MRRKQQEKEVGFSATTKLSKKNKLTREVKAEISQEEQAALNKQKYDRVVQLRKEHKDRYKKQVAEIKAKVQAEKEAKELKEKKEEVRSGKCVDSASLSPLRILTRALVAAAQEEDQGERPEKNHPGEDFGQDDGRCRSGHVPSQGQAAQQPGRWSGNGVRQETQGQ